MLTEETIFAMQEVDPDSKSVTISSILIIKRDGVEIARTPSSRLFQPGQIEYVKSYMGVTDSPEITYLESIWTQDVIDAFAQAMADAPHL